MKYMLMMNAPAGPYKILTWPPEDLERHIGFMRTFSAKLEKAGELVPGSSTCRARSARMRSPPRRRPHLVPAESR